MNYRKAKKLFSVLFCAGMLAAGASITAAEVPVPVNEGAQSEQVSEAGDGTETIPSVTSDGENQSGENANENGIAAEQDQNTLIPDAEKQEPVTPDTENQEPVVLDTENQDAIIPDTENQGPVTSDTENQESVILDTENQDAVIPDTENQEPVITGTENQDAVIPDTENQALATPDTENKETSNAVGENQPEAPKNEILNAQDGRIEEGKEAPAAAGTVLLRAAAPVKTAAPNNTDIIKAVVPGNTDAAKADEPENSGTVKADKKNVEKAVTAQENNTAANETVMKKETQSAAQRTAKASTRTSVQISAKTIAGGKTVQTTTQRTGGQPVPDGVYSFLSALNPFKALDIYHAKTVDKANAQAFDLNNSEAQHFRLTWHPEDGTYSIMNMKSGKYLDVTGGADKNGTNVQQYRGNNSRAQRWVIRQQADGSYTFLSALGKSERALDLKGGSSANETNLQIYRSNGTKAQKFFLQPYIPALQTKTTDGVYVLESAVRTDGTGVMDIFGADMKDGANVQLYEKNGTAAQQFSLVRSGDYYRIMSCSSGRVLGVRNGKTGNRSNVQQEQSSWLESQKWVINDAGDGSVYIKSASGDYYLDVAGGKTANKTNIQLYEGNGTKAQKFRLIREETGPVENGVYFIKSASNTSKAVDIWGASKKMEANAQLYNINKTDAQKFQFERGADGLYTVVNINSGHALDIAAGSMAEGANLQQYRINGSLAQKWIPRLNKDGSLLLINAKSGKMIDAANGKIASEANLQQEDYTGKASQRFKLEKTTGTVTKNLDYSIEPPPLSRMYPQAYAVLQQVGKNLQAAENWSAGLQFKNCNMDISVGTRKLADLGFTTHTGDCYVMSATLYEMAKILGYDAHFVFGYVPTASGNPAVHTWLEVDQDGEVLVLDPAFQHATGISGYMFPYKSRGTWRYMNYYRVN